MPTGYETEHDPSKPVGLRGVRRNQPRLVSCTASVTSQRVRAWQFPTKKQNWLKKNENQICHECAINFARPNCRNTIDFVSMLGTRTLNMLIISFHPRHSGSGLET